MICHIKNSFHTLLSDCVCLCVKYFLNIFISIWRTKEKKCFYVDTTIIDYACMVDSLQYVVKLISFVSLTNIEFDFKTLDPQGLSYITQ